MEHLFTWRVIIALGLSAICALIGLALGASTASALIALIGAGAAVLVAAPSPDLPGMESVRAPLPPPPPQEPTDPPASEILEAVAEPVLIVAHNRVFRANSSACALLGRHIVGEDVRLAIRHPAAAEHLLNTDPGRSMDPIHLVGLGTREQRWEMRVHQAGAKIRIVHLIERTGNYAAERMRVDFVANASHELRTPLASILGFIETLRDGAGEEADTRERFLKVMFDEAVRMQRLIDDLMSLSRIEAEKYRAPDAEVDLNAVIEEVCAELRGSHDPRANDLDCRSGKCPKIRGDRAQLSQLLHNIIGNAMKYGRPDTPIRITLRADGDTMARLSVADEGEGVDPDHLVRLTERFYRVDSGRSRAMGGTGLGLAIVKHIVERHRGRLDIASTPGKGTTVTVLLPLAMSSQRNADETHSPEITS
ncbi:hypothetical protein GCM10023219_01870 [Stakelama sediminis]|uniref:histidine kinase n=1 Tax=Stakelama sediminis TaxID=463200 RepID=A0A840Z0W1_9SPHN|nr:ATP-binding protein [Stakelama sediminis]MBB5719374.1 two-component system phosphate regulon sensor histidine kinase PhoR [Stakelama sediminis]